MTRTRLAFALTAALTCAALAGCGEDEGCSDIDLADDFTLALDAQPAAGERWIVDMEADGESACALAIIDGELRPPEADGELAEGCAFRTFDLETTADGLRIHLFDFTPDRIEVELRIDDVPAGSVTVEPVYRERHDSGACQGALEATVALDVQRPS